jgi:hypothetical protein
MMDNENKEHSPEEIQQSLFKLFIGKHRRARALRFWHKHLSPKARARKKRKRKMIKASRKYNFRRAKRK